MIERVLKAMVTPDLVVTPIEAIYDNEAGKIVCYREIKERNGVFIACQKGDWITPKKSFEYLLFDTIKEAKGYTDEHREELRLRLDEIKKFVIDVDRVFPGELRKIIMEIDKD